MKTHSELKREREKLQADRAYRVWIAVFGVQALIILWLWALGIIEVTPVSVLAFGVFVGLVVATAKTYKAEMKEREQDT